MERQTMPRTDYPGACNPTRYQHQPSDYGGENESQSPVQHPSAQQRPQQQQQQEEGYKFGDFTRSIIASGKKKSGRGEKDGYKFGDFTRGLFGS
jgi:hypothetical protein